jgi:hypothetical protein
MSDMINSTGSDEYDIICSPNMFEKIEKIEDRITHIESLLESISNKITIDNSQYSGNREQYLDMLQKIEEISKSNKVILQENRKMYTDSLEKIKETSKSNKEILQENRKMYTNALEKIQNTGEQNMDEIRPILNEMTSNTQKLENNICDPYFSSRIFYRNWRNNSTHINNLDTGNLNGLLGMPFITGLSKNTVKLNTVHYSNNK